MKERPILFSGPMVRAILDGRKTMTRRVVKRNMSGRVELHHRQWHIDDPRAFLASPYGILGDRLWVRETYQAKQIDSVPTAWNYRATDVQSLATWRPSIFMPRCASRITLEVATVRVERLQDITEADAKCEGVECPERGVKCSGFIPSIYPEMEPEMCVCADGYAPLFKSLWDSINKKRGFGWDVNPWVWVIEFNRLPQ